MVNILLAGDAAVTFEFGDAISPDLSERVIRAADALGAEAAPGVIEIVPTFRSFTVYFDPAVTCAYELADIVRRIGDTPSPARQARRLWSIPACYDAAVAPGVIVEDNSMAAAHHGRRYHVYMLGFLPGQPYLGNVDPAIRRPRLRQTRPVPAGSIGVAMEMTTIYPRPTPCGWTIVARTPSIFWNADEPLFANGDLAEFVAIDTNAFHKLEAKPAPPSLRLID